MHSWRMASLGALAALCLGVGTTHLQAGVLYTQPTNNFGGFYSLNDTNGGGNYSTVYDNFTLGSPATIASVAWVGSYVSGTPDPMSGVTISIWADSSGVPDITDPPLYTTSVSGNAGETYLGLDDFNDPTYTYLASINFAATAGTQYWLSIVPDVGAPPPWAWESGTGGDGASYQDSSGSLSSIAVDEAFTLSSANAAPGVPEPASAALLGGGLALLALAWRRFHHRPV
jgi:hypothetical protein